MIPTLEGFAQQLVLIYRIRINAATGAPARRSFCFTVGRKPGGNGTTSCRCWPNILAWWRLICAVRKLSDCPLDGYDKATMRVRDAHEVMLALGHNRQCRVWP